MWEIVRVLLGVGGGGGFVGVSGTASRVLWDGVGETVEWWGGMSCGLPDQSVTLL